MHFNRWSPDTCGCKNLYFVHEDDGSSRLASVEEVRALHRTKYDEWEAKLLLHGLTPNDVNSHSEIWVNKVKEARRAQRLLDVPFPTELTSGVKFPTGDNEQAPYEICRVHFDMGVGEEDDDSPKAAAKRGLIFAENQTKNHAITAVLAALNVPDADHGTVIDENIRWAFGPPVNGERAVRLVLDHPQAAARKNAILAEIASRTGGKVEIVDAL